MCSSSALEAEQNSRINYMSDLLASEVCRCEGRSKKQGRPTGCLERLLIANACKGRKQFRAILVHKVFMMRHWIELLSIWRDVNVNVD